MTKQTPFNHPKAPRYEGLPPAKHRTTRSGPELAEVHVQLEVVTPIFGGSQKAREVDEIDVIRAPSVRGHLRFWWRALYASQSSSAEDLYQRESALWGRASTDDGGRSAVETRVNIERVGQPDTNGIFLQPSKGQPQTPGAYALWPARSETKSETPTAPRRKAGTVFTLTLKVAASDTAAEEVRNALRAWILFGGYGGRTRRGLGSLVILGDASDWLPLTATREGFTSLFGFDIFAPSTLQPDDVPWLGGAAIYVGGVAGSAEKAWLTALNWLREFRQGTNGARQPGPSGSNQRPSISNWPEADKVRHLSTPKGRLRWAHTPRHNGTAAWPRAGFGLPIVGQFQSKSRAEHPTRERNGRADTMRWDELPPHHPNYGTEPDAFELRWRSPKPDHPREFDEHDRLASPLIVKALPLADGTFVACAMWLNRAYPAGSEVFVRGVNNSSAPFERLVAEGDTALFSALKDKASLRQAFFDWLRTKYQTTVVAP